MPTRRPGRTKALAVRARARGGGAASAVLMRELVEEIGHGPLEGQLQGCRDRAPRRRASRARQLAAIDRGGVLQRVEDCWRRAAPVAGFISRRSAKARNLPRRRASPVRPACVRAQREAVERCRPRLCVQRGGDARGCKRAGGVVDRSGLRTVRRGRWPRPRCSTCADRASPGRRPRRAARRWGRALPRAGVGCKARRPRPARSARPRRRRTPLSSAPRDAAAPGICARTLLARAPDRCGPDTMPTPSTPSPSHGPTGRRRANGRRSARLVA